MNGAEILLNTLVAEGVEVCFTNPGTSEMHFVAALDRVPAMRAVLCLFEGVASGAADGYARMSGKPAATLLHLGPGLGNAVANLHNARRGGVPVVNIVGDHATGHLALDAPLTSDIAGLAAGVSCWVETADAAERVGVTAARAVARARQGGVATLIFPADISWTEIPGEPEKADGECPPLPSADPAAVAGTVQALRSGDSTAILVGGRHLTRERGLLLSRIAEHTGARLITDTFPPRVERGAGSAVIERLPYLAEAALEQLQGLRRLILVETRPPVSFFAYPGLPGSLVPEGCEVTTLVAEREDTDEALRQVIEQLDARDQQPRCFPSQLPAPPQGPIGAEQLGAALARQLPDDAIVVDEGITGGMACYQATATAAAHDWLSLTGGAIGWGLPAAIGAAIACPGRKVIALEGDGSAMYTLQALWTMAREKLDVTVLLLDNRRYAILALEFARTGALQAEPGPAAASTLDIGSPDLDFVALANGMGVVASRVTTAQELESRLQEAVAEPGPCLIDVVLARNV